MDVHLPIAGISVNLLLRLGPGGAVGSLSGVPGVVPAIAPIRPAPGAGIGRSRRGRWRLIITLWLALLVPGAAEPRAQALVADLSHHLIAITTAFVGTNVVLFGVAEGGGDIVVTVQGPRQDQVVRRKSRIAGIWVNWDSLAFRRVPSYYAVASTGPLDKIARPDVQANLEIGVEHLKLEPIDAATLEISDIAAFQDALIRRKQEQGLYSRTPGLINFVGNELFRTTLAFPANVPPGIYQVQVFELKDGFAADAQRSTLVVSKVGLEADLFDFAQHRAPLYGLTAIALAIVSGWLASVIFRRG
jgi:uncharacterized protein (TIGR02186 family)